MPEVSLVAILDADKEGFLRSGTTLIQTIRRAARNLNGKAILYGDVITRSMQYAIDETERTRNPRSGRRFGQRRENDGGEKNQRRRYFENFTNFRLQHFEFTLERVSIERLGRRRTENVENILAKLFRKNRRVSLGGRFDRCRSITRL